MALNNNTVVPKVIAAALLLAYRQRRVYGARVNNTWRNALNNGGDTVIINRPLAGSVANYNRSTNITYPAVDINDAGLTLQLGGHDGIGLGGVVKYWSVKFDDLDRALSTVNILNSALVEYGEALANQVDADIRTAMVTTTVSNRQTLPEAKIDLDTIKDDTDALDRFGFELIHKALDWKRVPREGRWLIVGPAFVEALQKSVLSNETLLSTPQQSALANGRVGSLAGFTVYVADPKDSKYEAAVSSGPAENQHKKRYVETVVAGVDSATAFIDRIRRTERLRLENTFADAVRGLYEYNAKLLQPERLLTRNYGMEGANVTQLSLPAAVS